MTPLPELLLTVLSVLVLSQLLLPFARRIGHAWGLLDHPSWRRTQKAAVPCSGGAGHLRGRSAGRARPSPGPRLSLPPARPAGPRSGRPGHPGLGRRRRPFWTPRRKEAVGTDLGDQPAHGGGSHPARNQPARLGDLLPGPGRGSPSPSSGISASSTVSISSMVWTAWPGESPPSSWGP